MIDIEMIRETYPPMISSEQGKCIKILAQHKDLFPNPDEDLNSWLGRIEKKYIDSSKSSETSLEKKRIQNQCFFKKQTFFSTKPDKRRGF